MVAWSICTVLMGIVHNFGGLIGARVALGLAEGGLFPGVTYYISMSVTSISLFLSCTDEAVQVV